MQEWVCFTVFIYQYTQSFVFPEMAGGGYSLIVPLNPPLAGLSTIAHVHTKQSEREVENHYKIMQQLVEIPRTNLIATGS